MKLIRSVEWILAGLISGTLFLQAAVPPPEQLLPSDTLAFLTVPDWDKAAKEYGQSPMGQLWKDPAVKPFRDQLSKGFEADVVTPLERELGIKLADYAGLVRGQVTLAVVRNEWDGSSDKFPAFILLIDVKDQTDQLKTIAADLRKRWVEAGKKIKTDSVRGVEFTSLFASPRELKQFFQQIFSEEEAEEEIEENAENNGQFAITFGQSESLLLIGNDLKTMEKILIRQSGGLVPNLAEQAHYERDHAALFREALAFGWIHFKPIYDMIEQAAKKGSESVSANNPMAPRPDRILAATGLSGLKSIALATRANPEGSMVEFFLGVPQEERRGLFQIIAAEAKDSGPPGFVPAEAVSFSRWRLDGKKAWDTLEAMVTQISPEIASILQMGLATVGKDKDPNFDLKKNLIGNLGDDFISYSKKPRSATLEDLGSPPTLFLIGSPSAEQLASAAHIGASLLPIPNPETALREREFLGRKVYSVALPAMPGAEGGNPGGQVFSFAASGSFLAFSGDVPMLEEYLRGAENVGKTLRETPGLNEAAQKVGGMSTGFFMYENQRETMRQVMATLKNDSATLQNIISMAGIGSKFGLGGGEEGEVAWVDFDKLPAFDAIAKYFHFVVYSGDVTRQGFSWKMYAPNPPNLN